MKTADAKSYLDAEMAYADRVEAALWFFAQAAVRAHQAVRAIEQRRNSVRGRAPQNGISSRTLPP